MASVVEQWVQNLTQKRPYFTPLKRKASAWGTYHKHTGPAIRYAKVKVALAPGEELKVVDQLDRKKREWLEAQNAIDQIVFGVLDVVMTAYDTPINAFTLTIIDVEYDEVQSVPIAFRLAARQAAHEILSRQVEEA